MNTTINKTAKMIQVGDFIALKLCTTRLNDKYSKVLKEHDNKPRLCDVSEKKFIESNTEVLAKVFFRNSDGCKIVELLCADGNSYRFGSDATRIITMNGTPS